jgi:hypothetical protein
MNKKLKRASFRVRDRTAIPPALIKNLPLAISMIVGISVGLATARQFGLYLTLDSRFITALSVDDLIRNSLTALPITLFFWGIGILAAKSDFVGTAKPKRGLFARGLDAVMRIENPRFEIKASLWTFLGIAIFTANWPLYMSIQAAILFFALITWIYRTESELSKLPIDLYFAAYLIVAAFFAGAAQGQVLRQKDSSEHTLHFVNGTLKEGNLVSVTVSDFVFLDEKKKLSIIPRQQVHLVETKELEQPRAMVEIDQATRKIWGLVKSLIQKRETSSQDKTEPETEQKK